MGCGDDHTWAFPKKLPDYALGMFQSPADRGATPAGVEALAGRNAQKPAKASTPGPTSLTLGSPYKVELVHSTPVRSLLHCPPGGIRQGDGRLHWLLAHPLALSTRVGWRLPDRVPRRRQPVPPAAGRARPAARTPIHTARALPCGAQPLLPLAHRYGLCRLWLDRGGPRGRGHHGARRAFWACPLGADLGAPVGDLPLLCQHRPNLLRLRVGVDPAGNRLSGHLPGRRARGALDRHDLAAALGALPRHVRRRADQVARRSLLARPHLSLLSLRDATAAQSVELVLPLVARLGA